MALFDDNIQKQLKEILDQMVGDVTLLFFTHEIECQTGKDTHDFVNEIAVLNDKLNVKTYNFVNDKEKAEAYGVDKVPAIVLLDKDGQDTRMKYYGIPGGYEINSFLAGILMASGRDEQIPAELKKRIAAIDKPVHIQVFVSLGCPHCPNAVMTAHLLALENENVKADMVETSTFTHLAVRYNVSSVPKIVINEEHDFVGAQPLPHFLDVIEKA